MVGENKGRNIRRLSNPQRRLAHGLFLKATRQPPACGGAHGSPKMLMRMRGRHAFLVSFSFRYLLKYAWTLAQQGGSHLCAMVPSAAKWMPIRTRGPRKASSPSAPRSSRQAGSRSTARGQRVSSSRYCAARPHVLACGFPHGAQPCAVIRTESPSDKQCSVVCQTFRKCEGLGTQHEAVHRCSR